MFHIMGVCYLLGSDIRISLSTHFLQSSLLHWFLTVNLCCEMDSGVFMAYTDLSGENGNVFVQILQ